MNNNNLKKLYSNGYIINFSSFFTVFAGSILISINLFKLGKKKLIFPVLLLGVILTTGISYLSPLLEKLANKINFNPKGVANIGMDFISFFFTLIPLFIYLLLNSLGANFLYSIFLKQSMPKYYDTKNRFIPIFIAILILVLILLIF